MRQPYRIPVRIRRPWLSRRARAGGFRVIRVPRRARRVRYNRRGRAVLRGIRARRGAVLPARTPPLRGGVGFRRVAAPERRVLPRDTTALLRSAVRAAMLRLRCAVRRRLPRRTPHSCRGGRRYRLCGYCRRRLRRAAEVRAAYRTRARG